MTCSSHFLKYDIVTEQDQKQDNFAENKQIYSDKTDLYFDPFFNNVIISSKR